MKDTRSLLLKRIGEMLLDAILVVLAFVLAYYARIGQLMSTDFPFQPYFQIALIAAPVFWFFFTWSGLYSLRDKSPWELLRMISFACLAGAMLFVLIFFFKRELFFSRAIALLIWFFSTILVFSVHYLLQKMRQLAHRRGEGIGRTLIIGNGRAAESIIRSLRSSGSRLQAVAILAPYGGGNKEILGVPVLGKLDALERITETQKIDAILQTEAAEQTINLLSFAEGKFLEFLMAPSILGAFRRELTSEKIGDVPFLRLNLSPLFGWGQLWKRAFDVALAGILVVIFLPVLLFKQKRTVPRACGTGNDTFQKYEFESARGFLKYVPEFINVLKGQMSMIGPRPRPPEERERLKLYQRRRLVVRPGIFGPWQLERLHGAPEDSEKQIELDTKYVFTWSFWTDIKLFWSCFWAIVSRK